MQRLTREQAAVISAATGVLVGPFSDMHEYIEKIMGRPVFTHELGSRPFAKEIAEKAKPDLLAICATDEKADA